MKYAWINQHRGKYPIELMCKVLQVKRSSYLSFAQLDTTEKDKLLQQEQALIKEVFEKLKHSSGTRCMKGHLKHEHKIIMSRRKIGRLMHELGLQVKTTKKFKKSETSPINSPLITSNRLKRQFNVRYMNQAWVGDITQIKTQQGWVYLATYIDLYSRRVVGWAVDTHMRSELVETALKRALWNRKPPKGLIVHTDQGSQFISHAYRKLLKHWSIKQSMSRRGNCWDNAVIESFFKSLKTEEVYQLTKLISQQEMKWLIAEYMGHYNNIRPHSYNDYIAPAKFEALRLEHLAEIEKSVGTK